MLHSHTLSLYLLLSRLQLLEDLVQGQFKQRRQELLLQLSSSDDSQRVGHSILPKAPEEFKLGEPLVLLLTGVPC